MLHANEDSEYNGMEWRQAIGTLNAVFLGAPGVVNMNQPRTITKLEGNVSQSCLKTCKECTDLARE